MPPSTNTPQQNNFAHALAELEDLLRRQLAAARNGEYQTVRELSPDVDRAVQDAGAYPIATEDATATLTRIRNLRVQLTRTLHAHRAEQSQKLRRTRHGGRALHAYRQGPSPQ